MNMSSSVKSNPELQRGFTVIELIMVIVIAGILAIAVAPRFFDNSMFQSRGFADQVQASLRYAQKIAIAQRRFVCVNIASNSLSLAIGTAATCGTPLTSLSGGGNYVFNAPAGVTVTSAAFDFNALGRPVDASGTPLGAQTTITISGATNSIIVEAETGYVHSP